MATEHGVFNAEGCLERDFWDLQDAQDAASRYRDESDDEDVYAAALCPDHEEQPASPNCEECVEELTLE